MPCCQRSPALFTSLRLLVHRPAVYLLLGLLACADLWPLIRPLRGAAAATWCKQTGELSCSDYTFAHQTCLHLGRKLCRSILLLYEYQEKISSHHDDITCTETERVNLTLWGFVGSTNAAHVSESIDFYSTEYCPRTQYWDSIFNLIFGIDLALDSLRKAAAALSSVLTCLQPVTLISFPVPECERLL